MTTVTVTAHYRMDPDAAFALALDLEALNRDLGGLIDYHGLPRINTYKGHSYSFTPVLWTWFRHGKVDVTTTRVDPVACVVESVATDADTPENTTQYTTQITPTPDGCLWTDTMVLSGPPVSRLQRALTRHIHKASHRRRRAKTIRIDFADT